MKRALVTGSSRGIGRAIALRLAQDGFEVIIHGKSPSEKLDQLKKEIEQAGGKAIIVAADLSDLEVTKAMAASLPPVDVLISNASFQIRRHWTEISEEDAHRQLNCNFLSALILMQAVAPHMQQNGWGRIVTIGSVQEAKPHPDMLIYSAAKVAQTNMVQSLALQLAKSGITVNNVAPGVILTDRNTEALADAAYAQKVADSIPAGFFGEPEDVVGIVSLLCSEEGRYITGQSIFVDGGKML